MMYRALRDLGLGNGVIKAGSIFPAARIKGGALAILEQQNKVAPANLPPIIAIGRLKSKAAALGRIGVIDAGQFIEMDDSALARALKSDEATVRQIKAEMYAQFATPPPVRD